MQYTKSDIRKMMNAKRKQLDNIEVNKSGHFIYNNLINNIIINSDYDLVLSFASYKNEPDTFIIYEKLKNTFSNIDIAVPLVCDDNINMEFYLLESLDNLRDGYKGIREPDTDKCHMLSIGEISLKYKKIAVLMPGLAYDEEGNRSGYGGGFYDRYLARLEKTKAKIIKIGICHDFQILATGIIPHDAHDITVDYIITPTRTISVK